MKAAVFSARPYDRRFLGEAASGSGHELRFFEAHLSADTAVLAAGCDAACVFVNDDAGAASLQRLAAQGVRLLALRSAGFNHVDLGAARALGLTVARVPAYSPSSVAEHALALILALDRRLVRAHNRMRDGNFSLDGLLGFQLHGRTVGVVGTGAIGAAFARIMAGLGCEVIASDPRADPALLGTLRYVGIDELWRRADIVSLHCPLTAQTRHLVDAAAIACMKPDVMLINTSRGALVDTRAVIDALKSGRLGYLGLDVYEEEEGLFFEDHSGQVIQDDLFMRLLTFPNVLITGHQAFFTAEAMARIAAVTIGNLTAFETGQGPLHRVPA